MPSLILQYVGHSLSLAHAHIKLVTCTAVLAFVFAFLKHAFTPPANLRHLPCVPVLPLIWSYLSGEPEDRRIKRLIVPFARDKKEGIVLVYAMGHWIAHVLDHKIGRDMCANPSVWNKSHPPKRMLFWRFVGDANVILSDGETWKRHSRIVKSALDRNIPIERFVAVTQKLFRLMGDGGELSWDDLSGRFALDAVGATALGYDFNAIGDKHNPLVNLYSQVMTAIASPLYLVFPILEEWFPRHKVIAQIDELLGKLLVLLEEKKQNKGHDLLTYMLEEPEMTDIEFRDNMVVFFIAGHDTTAAGITSLIYYLARFPELQDRAREEVIAALGPDDPSIDNLRNTPFLQACIRESLRINPPVTVLVPRCSDTPQYMQSSLGKKYYIPANIPVILDICSVHYTDEYWPEPYNFDPKRFVGELNDNALMDASLWLTFGLGPRRCPARRFAMYELRTITSMLLREWKWTLPDDSPHKDCLINGIASFTLSMPTDMKIVFSKI